jgi:hypothetical protein
MLEPLLGHAELISVSQEGSDKIMKALRIAGSRDPEINSG